MEHLLTTIARFAKEHGLPVLLIGGHAVTALGHPRATYDVDLLIPRSSIDGWRRQLLRLNYRVFGESENFLQFEPQPDWPLPAVDLMLVDDEVFRALDDRKETTAPLPTPNVEAMIALKLHALNQPSRRNPDRDWSDVLGLIDAHRLTLDDPSFSAMVRKHGGASAITRIAAHLTGGDSL